jgi:hypothetical protein
MRRSLIRIAVASCLLGVSIAHAQYKGPRDYFPKKNPVPGVNSNNPQPPARTPPNNQPPARPQQPKFKDLPVNTPFYFLADTNRAFTWVKVSSTTATNAKNGVVQAIAGEVPVQK